MPKVIWRLLVAASMLAGCGDSGNGSNQNDALTPICGNGVTEAGEYCDDGENNSDTAPDACRTNCELPYCGDGVKDSNESCDDRDLGLFTCQDLGYNRGTLACDYRCEFDTAGCHTCGDGVIEFDEQCDATNLNEQTCASRTGFQDGALACSEDCLFDESDCHFCGNSTVEGPEVCDDGNREDGDGCSGNCRSDETCGNGIVDVGETCDDASANSDTVPDACRTDCVLPSCGDDVADTGETCDGTDLRGEDCTSLGLGFNGGTLACLGNCQLDTGRCYTCGDGVCGTNETPTDCPQECGVAALSAGFHNTCAVLTDGTARCWGYNSFGQLGDGTTTNSATPVVVSGLGDAVDISAAGNNGQHSCAVLADGTARCWGANQRGQLGNGGGGASSVPVTVSGISTAVAVTAGGDHTCALLSDQSAVCWGENASGELGDGSTIFSNVPVAVSGLAGVVAVSAGAQHTCAVLSDGTARCWGANADGQLGNGTTDATTVPSVVSGLTNAAGISGGWRHTCALLSDNSGMCWGWNFHGQLGNGTNTTSHVPVTVSNRADAEAVSAGGASVAEHTCAVLSGGAGMCWGANFDGQLGDGTNNNSNVPVAVMGPTGFSAISAGRMHTCAVPADGKVWCWGHNAYGQLGDGTNNYSNVPVAVLIW